MHSRVKGINEIQATRADLEKKRKSNSAEHIGAKK
jgi:hypothetical protein